MAEEFLDGALSVLSRVAGKPENTAQVDAELTMQSIGELQRTWKLMEARREAARAKAGREGGPDAMVPKVETKG